MEGTVRYTSINKLRIAVETDSGFVVFDLEEGEAQLWHMISGIPEDHGSATVTNETTGHTLSVYIEAIQATDTHARSLLRHI